VQLKLTIIFALHLLKVAGNEKEGRREGGKCPQYVWERGNGGLFKI
jgi:hypothetical protein